MYRNKLLSHRKQYDKFVNPGALKMQDLTLTDQTMMDLLVPHPTLLARQ